jgi:antitoxin (DNA-binding transcriptional repressor) of toxin-antitoxin stability system
MEKTVNIHTAKTTLSKLIAEVEDAGKPVVRLVAVKEKKKKSAKKIAADRKPGFMKGKIKILKGFYDPLPDDMLAAMLGDDD